MARDPRIFNSGYIGSLSHFDLDRYYSKIALCGVDPYELSEEECSQEMELWPKISDVDRMDYFIYQTSFVTKEAMKSLKSLEGHNFFTSGFVLPPLVKEVDPEMVIVLSKVRIPFRLCWLGLLCYIGFLI